VPVLALDISGIPRQWISYDDAISYHASDSVAWSMGGMQKDGTQSYLETPSIIAVMGHLLLKEARIELLYLPYEPNHWKNMILQNRNIVADQMEFLQAGLPKHSRSRPD
jgi:hypothetical protein